MATVLNPPTKLAAEERFVLRNVSWETYEQILKNYESSSSPRFTYDQGNLEIMSPSQPHEALSRIIAKLPIYAAMGVPEIWLFENDEVRILRLLQGQYSACDESVVLPRVLAQDVTRFVAEAATSKRPQWLRNIREWIRSLDK